MHWVNGSITEQISIHDRGLLYGDGLFETMLWDAGGIQLLTYHLERLQSGCELLRIQYPDTLRVQLKHAVDAAVADGLRAAVIKVIVTRGRGQRGYAPRANQDPTVIISVSAAVLPEAGQVARLHLCENRLAIGSPLAGLKHLNRLEQVIAADEVSRSACDEGLMLDYEGTVVSGTRSNVFIVRDSCLYTPALDRCGIKGTLRRLVIEQLSESLNLEVKVVRLSLAEVEAANEIFYCNSLVGIMPVAFFRGKNYKEFGVTEALSAALQQTVVEVG